MDSFSGLYTTGCNEFESRQGSPSLGLKIVAIAVFQALRTIQVMDRACDAEAESTHQNRVENLAGLMFEEATG